MTLAWPPNRKSFPAFVLSNAGQYRQEIVSYRWWIIIDHCWQEEYRLRAFCFIHFFCNGDAQRLHSVSSSSSSFGSVWMGDGGDWLVRLFRSRNLFRTMVSRRFTISGVMESKLATSLSKEESVELVLSKVFVRRRFQTSGFQISDPHLVALGEWAGDRLFLDAVGVMGDLAAGISSSLSSSPENILGIHGRCSFSTSSIVSGVGTWLGNSGVMSNLIRNGSSSWWWSSPFSLESLSVIRSGLWMVNNSPNSFWRGCCCCWWWLLGDFIVVIVSSMVFMSILSPLFGRSFPEVMFRERSLEGFMKQFHVTAIHLPSPSSITPTKYMCCTTHCCKYFCSRVHKSFSDFRGRRCNFGSCVTIS